MHDHTKKRSREEAPQSESGIDLSGYEQSPEAARYGKRRRLARPNVGDNNVENIGRRTYEHTSASGHAKVQYGDQVVNIRNFYAGTPAETSTSGEAPDVGVLLAATWSRLRKQNPKTGWKNSLMRILNYLLSRLPKLLFVRVSTFEDAFGRSFRIDIDTISDWPEFDGLLRCKFEKTRGFCRVRNREYRLQDWQDSCLIDPQQNKPEFRTLFQPGKYIVMSIHFDEDEVTLGRCPRCSMEQEPLLGTQTVCSTCCIAYTAEKRIDDTFTAVADLLYWSTRLRRQLVYKDLDRPEHFNRISIGTTPKTQPAQKDSLHGEVEMLEVDENYNRDRVDDLWYYAKQRRKNCFDMIREKRDMMKPVPLGSSSPVPSATSYPSVQVEYSEMRNTASRIERNRSSNSTTVEPRRVYKKPRMRALRKGRGGTD